jgi:putative tryptophan/tyrosine transport system substrate-binding protein
MALGAGALAAPFRAFAQQQGKVWRVGFLLSRHVDFVDSDYSFGPFMQGMRELGYVEGNNLVVEWRSAEGKYERVPELATELVNLKVDVIVAAGTPATRALEKATTTIPIVMVGIGDPVASGFVRNLARPERNITGFSILGADISPKLLEMVHTMAPKVSRVAVLVHPANPAHAAELARIEVAARNRSIRILRAEAGSPKEIDDAFSLIRQQNPVAVIVLLDPFFQTQKKQIVELMAKHRLPSIAGYFEYVEAGGLMSYGANISDPYRRAANYVDKILKGAKPSELPVEQPTKFELVINGKTAKALGLKIPQSLLIMADKVIE